MDLLAVDPGKCAGWSWWTRLLDGTYSLRRYGLADGLPTRQIFGLISRLRAASRADQHGMECVIETQYVGKNPAVAMKIVMSRARWQIPCEVKAIPIHKCQPSQWQSVVLGGRAKRDLVKERARNRVLAYLPGDIVPPQDACDAICIGVWYAKANGCAVDFSDAPEQAEHLKKGEQVC